MSNNLPHKFLRYNYSSLQIHEARKIAQYVINHYKEPVGNTSISQYNKMKSFRIDWKDSKGTNHTGQVHFNELVDHICCTRSLDVKRFNFPTLQCNWLDCAGLAIMRNFHILEPHNEPVKLALQTPFGERFPLKPGLDREGLAYASFQIPIQKNLVYLHKQVVGESEHSVTADPRWLNNLRLLINECISIVDITLHQLYSAAEYGIKSAWKFDLGKLNKKPGMRITDKFHWVGQITERPLDNAKSEIDSFNILRGIRNHLNHFEPACFAATAEDVMDWLNRVPKIGYLLWKIREKLEAQLTPELIEIMLLPEVAFYQKDATRLRLSQPEDSGYSSCIDLKKAPAEKGENINN